MRAALSRLSRQCFYALLVRPVLLILLGFNVRHLERLKPRGAHLIAANHNSHLDSLVLMSLFGFSDIPKVKLVAAKDYWCRNKFLTWLSLNLIGIIPIERKVTRGNDPLASILKALDEGYTLVIFPEGSRGEPEQRQPLKGGVAHVLESRPAVTVTPVFMYGLGKALRRGEAFFVPFVCTVNIGEPIEWQGDRRALVAALDEAFGQLEQEIAPKPWA